MALQEELADKLGVLGRSVLQNRLQRKYVGHAIVTMASASLSVDISKRRLKLASSSISMHAVARRKAAVQQMFSRRRDRGGKVVEAFG